MEGHTDRDAARENEDEGERLDRELIELLNEVRVAMPGVQVLFGFLLTVPFQQGFQRINETQKYIYFVTLLLSAAATAMLIAPSAYHRILFREHQKPLIVKQGSRQLLIGLAFLALAMTGAVFLITDILFASTTVVAVVAAVAVLYAWMWFGIGLVRKLRGGQAW